MAQLRRLAHEFQQRKTRILLVCFAQEHWARAFLEETGSPFPLLMDPERESYRAFGLKSSLARTYFSPATIRYYAKAILMGRKFHPKPRGNPHQMGRPTSSSTCAVKRREGVTRQNDPACITSR